MGAWGVKTFENDYALDWIEDFLNQGKKNFVINSLSAIKNANGYIEAPECSEALCAIEIIARYKANEIRMLDERISEWFSVKRGLFKKPVTFNQVEFDLAKEVLIIILNNSELKELWEESDSYNDWINYNNELIDLLV